jgi:hypothetical protein
MTDMLGRRALPGAALRDPLLKWLKRATSPAFQQDSTITTNHDDPEDRRCWPSRAPHAQRPASLCVHVARPVLYRARRVLFEFTMMMAGTLLIGLGQAARQAWRAPRRAVLSLRLAWWLVLVSLLARVTSLPRVQWFLSLRATSIGTTTTGSLWRHAGPRAADRPSPEQLARAIDAILRLDLPTLRRGRCWKRALVLQRFLARQGIDCRVTFGVRRTSNGVLQGHAWLERDGQPLLEFEPGTNTYVVTFRLR